MFNLFLFFLKDQTHRSLIEDKVCRFMAVGLLRPCDKFNLSDFKTAWQGSVPEGKPYLCGFMYHNKLKHAYKCITKYVVWFSRNEDKSETTRWYSTY